MADPVGPAEGCAFAFPGVGVRFCGREAAFAAAHPAVLRYLEAASKGVDLRSILAGSDTDGVTELDAQRFGFAFSCGVAEGARTTGLRPMLVAGYSHGLYAALVAGGALGFGAGLACMEAAYACMKAAKIEPGGLGVIVGLDRGDVEACLEGEPDNGGPARALDKQRRPKPPQIVNENHDSSFVIAGAVAPLDRALERAASLGALKSLRVRAELPYHHANLAPALPAFSRFLDQLAWQPPDCPVLSCIDQAAIVDVNVLKRHVTANLATPIHWRRTVEAMAARKISTVLECGAGISLTQNARFLACSPRFVPIGRVP